MPFSCAICGSVRAAVQSEHLYRGSCYHSGSPDRCYDALRVLTLCTQEICVEGEREKDVRRAKLFFRTHSPQVPPVSRHLGNVSAWRALNHIPLSQTRGRSWFNQPPPFLPRRLTRWSRAAFFSQGTEELCGVPSLSLCVQRVCGGGTAGACGLCGLVLSGVWLWLWRQCTPAKVRERVPVRMPAPLWRCWTQLEFLSRWVGSWQTEAGSMMERRGRQMGGHFVGSDKSRFCSL